mmetsp:Transcript_63408/g.138070  ORF Transcript_63408/g.138070 Transcript_63408/m.138070 type:complete len:98 (+) Transcript_63408:822-1115(+)
MGRNSVAEVLYETACGLFLLPETSGTPSFSRRAAALRAARMPQRQAAAGILPMSQVSMACAYRDFNYRQSGCDRAWLSEYLFELGGFYPEYGALENH